MTHCLLNLLGQLEHIVWLARHGYAHHADEWLRQISWALAHNHYYG